MDRFEKAKTVKSNENTSMSKEVRVGFADKSIAIVSCAQKYRVKRREG